MTTPKEKLDYLSKKFGSNFADQIGDNLEAIDHYYKANYYFGMGITDADDWAWLNTLFRYDIGANHALGIIRWFYENEDATVMDCVNVDQKETLQNICEWELGFYLNFNHWPENDPNALEFGFKEYIDEEPSLTKLFTNFLGVLEEREELWGIVEDLIEAGATKEQLEYLGYEDFIEEE